MSFGSASRRGPDDALAAISVIVITFNEERNIRNCLESLLAQDYPPELHEIIVVDASTDATPEIVAAYPRVRLVRAPKGFSTQKNAGVKEARYGILAFTDADCLAPPDWLRVIDRTFRDGALDAAGGNAFPPSGVSRFGFWSSCTGHPAGGAVGFDASVTPGPGAAEFAAGCNSVYRREAIASVGGFSLDFRDGAEDMDISRRLRAAGFRIDYVPDLDIYHLPRPTLRSFVLWNVRVGISKFNLRRPGLLRILLNPFFPPWPLLVLAALTALPGVPMVPAAVIVSAFVFFPLFLLFAVKPYRLLWQRRRKIGISAAAAYFIVPSLIAIRQSAISWGEMKKWTRSRRVQDSSGT